MAANRIERSLKDSLVNRLHGDAICVMWIKRYGKKTGDHVNLKFFSLKDGTLSGEYSVFEPGFKMNLVYRSNNTKKYKGKYSNLENLRSIAKRAVSTLLNHL